MKDTAKNNERMAAFCGYTRAPYYPKDFYDKEGFETIQVFDPSHPERLHDLFQVVDSIREKTGCHFRLDSMHENRNYHHCAFDNTMIEAIGVEHFYRGEGETRIKAIYAACLAAIEHLEKES